jgi:hypothetical protein
VAKARKSSLLFRTLLVEGITAGEVRDDLDLDCVIRLIHSAIYGLLDSRFRLTTKGGRVVGHFSAQQVSDTLNAIFAGGLTT